MLKAGLWTGLAGLLLLAPSCVPGTDQELTPLALDASTKGCDLLDPAHCLYPFPSDHFTELAPEGSPQSQALGGTGRRVAFQPNAMPQNAFGKFVDPTEWNRNDGFSTGQLIVTYVPHISLVHTYGAPLSELGVADLRKSLDTRGPVQILRVDEDESGNVIGVERHLAWAERDLNAGIVVQSGPDNGGVIVDNPTETPIALLIRPGVNFEEGARYVVVLRNLRDTDGEAIPAQTGFRVCRDEIGSALPEVQERCAQLEDRVFPALDEARIPRDDSLYLAWDFTVQSENGMIGRLRSMRDKAFALLAPAAPPGVDCSQHVDGNGCVPPPFTIDEVLTGGDVEGGIFRQIHGTMTVPSFVTPISSPGQDPAIQAALTALENGFPDEFADLFEGGDIATSLSVPPNRLFYNPADLINPLDPQGAPYGDGLPDFVTAKSVPFMCQIPDVASAADPALAGIYGHGLLDRRVAITYDGVDDISREHNYMFCAVDWFGFATGDIGNVATALIDISYFPVIPDAGQQGILHFAYLARLIRHPEGLASSGAFQNASGQPLFDRSDVYYDGNSQGGILGGAVMAISKDVTRGILGSLGANYSILLRRSKDFDLYSVPLYLSYSDPLDRNFLFSFIQMVWDRGENNAYAPHIVDNTAFDGPDNTALLHPMFGDHEVTMWSADIMARTMGIPANYEMVEATGVALAQPDRHPDLVPGFDLDVLDFSDPADRAGSGLVQWDGYTLSDPTDIPPTGNVPPRTGRNPHDDSAKKSDGRCHKALFLRPGGEITDPVDLVVGSTPILVDGVPCI